MLHQGCWVTSKFKYCLLEVYNTEALWCKSVRKSSINKGESGFGAHVLVFIDIKAIEVHNIYEYLTTWSKSIALYINMAGEHDSWVKLDIYLAYFFFFSKLSLSITTKQKCLLLFCQFKKKKKPITIPLVWFSI